VYDIIQKNQMVCVLAPIGQVSKYYCHEIDTKEIKE
jgi:hypothetical protein